MTDTNKNWYVVYTLPRWEKKVALLLTDRGIDHYCPLNKVNRQWSDRRKTVIEPLFKGYVFVHVTDKNKWEVRDIRGILNFVHWQGKPAIVQDKEMETIRKFLQEFSDVEVLDQQMEVGKEVVIKQGLLMNYKGILIEVAGNKAKVRIDSMGLQLSAVFEKKNLEQLR
jgi:transcription antitermination factor NusG